MQKIESHIRINAKSEMLWETLQDFNSYPLWNSLIMAIDGNALPGEHLDVMYQFPNRSNMVSAKVTVLKNTPNRHFQWVGNLETSIPFELNQQFIIVDQESHSILHNVFGYVTDEHSCYDNQFVSKIRYSLIQMNIGLKSEVEYKQWLLKSGNYMLSNFKPI